MLHDGPLSTPDGVGARLWVGVEVAEVSHGFGATCRCRCTQGRGGLAGRTQAMGAVLRRTQPPGQGFDIFLQDFFGQQAGHVRVMLEQLELRVDRSIEKASKSSGGWRLFGGGAMLRGRNRASSLVIGLVDYPLGRTPTPCRASTNPEYTSLSRSQLGVHIGKQDYVCSLFLCVYSFARCRNGDNFRVGEGTTARSGATQAVAPACGREIWRECSGQRAAERIFQRKRGPPNSY